MNKKIVISLLAVSVLMLIASFSGFVIASLEQGETNNYDTLNEEPKGSDVHPVSIELNQRWSSSRLIYTDGVDCYYEGYAQEQKSEDGSHTYKVNVPKVVKGAC